MTVSAHLPFNFFKLRVSSFFGYFSLKSFGKKKFVHSVKTVGCIFLDNTRSHQNTLAYTEAFVRDRNYICLYQSAYVSANKHASAWSEECMYVRGARWENYMAQGKSCIKKIETTRNTMQNCKIAAQFLAAPRMENLRECGIIHRRVFVDSAVCKW